MLSDRLDELERLRRDLPRGRLRARLRAVAVAAASLRAAGAADRRLRRRRVRTSAGWRLTATRASAATSSASAHMRPVRPPRLRATPGCCTDGLRAAGAANAATGAPVAAAAVALAASSVNAGPSAPRALAAYRRRRRHRPSPRRRRRRRAPPSRGRRPPSAATCRAPSSTRLRLPGAPGSSATCPTARVQRGGYGRPRALLHRVDARRSPVTNGVNDSIASTATESSCVRAHRSSSRMAHTAARTSTASRLPVKRKGTGRRGARPARRRARSRGSSTIPSSSGVLRRTPREQPAVPEHGQRAGAARAHSRRRAGGAPRRRRPSRRRRTRRRRTRRAAGRARRRRPARTCATDGRRACKWGAGASDLRTRTSPTATAACREWEDYSRQTAAADATRRTTREAEQQELLDNCPLCCGVEPEGTDPLCATAGDGSSGAEQRDLGQDTCASLFDVLNCDDRIAALSCDCASCCVGPAAAEPAAGAAAAAAARPPPDCAYGVEDGFDSSCIVGGCKDSSSPSDDQYADFDDGSCAPVCVPGARRRSPRQTTARSPHRRRLVQVRRLPRLARRQLRSAGGRRRRV